MSSYRKRSPKTTTTTTRTKILRHDAKTRSATESLVFCPYTLLVLLFFPAQLLYFAASYCLMYIYSQETLHHVEYAPLFTSYLPTAR